MEIEEVIRRLEKHKGTNPFLTIYLSASGKRTLSGQELQKQLLFLSETRLTKEQHKQFASQLKQMEDYLLGQFDSRGKRSLVLISNKKNLQSFSFEFPLEPLLNIGPGPFLEPLEKAINLHQRYLILLVDREKAKFFTVRLGKIETKDELYELEVPQNVKTQKMLAGRDDKFFRHIEWHMHRHLQKVAKQANEFAKGKKIYFLLIGGHKEIIKKMKNHLLYPLNKLPIGNFTTSLNVPINELLQRSKIEAATIHKLKT